MLTLPRPHARGDSIPETATGNPERTGRHSQLPKSKAEPETEHTAPPQKIEIGDGDGFRFRVGLRFGTARPRKFPDKRKPQPGLLTRTEGNTQTEE